jgi:integrase
MPALPTSQSFSAVNYGHQVKLSLDKKVIRLRWTHEQQEYVFYLGLNDTALNRKKALNLRDIIELDIQTGTLDTTLDKYRYILNPPRDKVSLVTVSEHFNYWLQHRQSNLNGRTITWYKTIVVELDEFFGSKPYNRIGTVDASGYSAMLVGKQPALKADTIKRRIAAVKNAFKWLLDSGLVSYNVFDNSSVKLPSSKPVVKDPFSHDEVQIILKAFQTHRKYRDLYPYVLFLFMTGARIGEVLGLQKKHFSRLYHHVRIEQQLTRGQYKATKNETVREFDLPEVVADACQEMADEWIDNYWLQSGDTDEKRWNVFDNSPMFIWNGESIRDDWFRNGPWKQVLHDCGIRYRRPYTTRHTFVSHALQSGMEEIQLAAITGHTLAVMIGNYAQYTEKNLKVPVLYS